MTHEGLVRCDCTCAQIVIYGLYSQPNQLYF